MSIEIERKFIIKPSFPKKGLKRRKIRQGFLTDDPERAVRIRILGNKGFITIKGKSDKSGLSRYEFETEIPINDAEQLLLLSADHIIEKTRYYFRSGDHVIEIDEFEGVNKGLFTAEIELTNEDEYFEKPDWFIKEVTGDIRYYNQYLSKKPYCEWLD